jgi:hypothetical protein
MKKVLPRHVDQEIPDLSMLRHGNYVIIMKDGRKIDEGILQGRPWSQAHSVRGLGNKLRSTVPGKRESDLVSNMITLAPVPGRSRSASSKGSTNDRDFKVDDRVKVLRRTIIP